MFNNVISLLVRLSIIGDDMPQAGIYLSHPKEEQYFLHDRTCALIAVSIGPPAFWQLRLCVHIGAKIVSRRYRKSKKLSGLLSA